MIKKIIAFIVPILLFFSGTAMMNYGFDNIPENVVVKIPGNGNIILLGSILASVGILSLILVLSYFLRSNNKVVPLKN